MKNTILMTLLISLFVSMTASANTTMYKSDQNDKMCQLFEMKVKDYKQTMRDDEYAKATLASYEKRAAIYCSSDK